METSLKCRVPANEFKDFLMANYTEVLKYARWVAQYHKNRNSLEIAQETYCIAIEKYTQYNPAYTVQVWIHEIAKNLSLQKVAKADMHARHEEKIYLAGASRGEVDSPLDTMCVNDDIEVVQKVLAELSERDRQIVLWKVQEDCTYAEIARRLGNSLTIARIDQIFKKFCQIAREKVETVA